MTKPMKRSMPVHITPDSNTPTASVELAITLALPDYDLDEVEKSTPRQIDEILVSQGFRDLVDDARGVLTDLLSQSGFEIAQFTGAICPGDDEVYRPGLWIIVRNALADPKTTLSGVAQERLGKIARELSHRLGLN